MTKDMIVVLVAGLVAGYAVGLVLEFGFGVSGWPIVAAMWGTTLVGMLGAAAVIDRRHRP